MKNNVILVLLVIILSSCEYSIKSDRELRQYESNVDIINYNMELIQMENDSLNQQIADIKIADSIELSVYKDSIAFVRLMRVLCYDNNEHRHSCEKFCK